MKKPLTAFGLALGLFVGLATVAHAEQNTASPDSPSLQATDPSQPPETQPQQLAASRSQPTNADVCNTAGPKDAIDCSADLDKRMKAIQHQLDEFKDPLSH